MRRRRRGAVLAGAAALALGVLGWGVLGAGGTASRSAPATGAAMRAADFLATIGVNTHIGSEPYNDAAALARLLAHVGIGSVRQTAPIDAAGLATMQALGRSGARLAVIVNGGGPVDLPGALRTIRQLGPFLEAVEGPNEVAIWPIAYRGLGGVPAAVALQKDLYAAVRADRAFDGASVYVFTLGGVDPAAYPEVGDLSAHADFANVHSYPPHGLRPIFVLHAAIAGGRTSAASRPVVVTETGYYTLPQHTEWGGVPEPMQAAYLLGLLLDQAAAGTARTYLYDLIDDGTEPGNREHHFGLFRHDLSPKPAADALHAMAAILADPGPARRSFTPRALPFTAVGVPYNHTGNTLTLEKSDGTQVLALWNQQPSSDPAARLCLRLKQHHVTVTFPRPYRTVHVFDPMAGEAPVRTLHDAASFELVLTDHPLLVVIPAEAGRDGA